MGPGPSHTRVLLDQLEQAMHNAIAINFQGLVYVTLALNIHYAQTGFRLVQSLDTYLQQANGKGQCILLDRGCKLPDR